MAVPQKPGGGFNRPPGGGYRPGGGGGFNKGGFNRGRFMPRKEAEHRINNLIRVPQVRLVGENVEVGIYETQEALKLAQAQELDLVEISPNVDPPVCKIIDYNKFLYDKKKKEKEMKAKSKASEVKEIRFTPNTDDHDFDFKAKHAESFLKEGNKVKAYVQFKGRAIQFQDRGQLLLLKFAERLAEVGILENMPKMEGRRMLAMFAPKGKKKA
ncbi:MAG TPA: translation initiation factor IF-3 [Chitinophagaceae bacterium]|nr:translation initiation factor IF-3 [Chitinophagaceae bacterium]HNK61064.1 translation initiation factor IF-3 [Chitinophagaceae bacterium]